MKINFLLQNYVKNKFLNIFNPFKNEIFEHFKFFQEFFVSVERKYLKKIVIKIFLIKKFFFNEMQNSCYHFESVIPIIYKKYLLTLFCKYDSSEALHLSTPFGSSSKQSI